MVDKMDFVNPALGPQEVSYSTALTKPLRTVKSLIVEACGQYYPEDFDYE
ncbi:MAG: hypothetical protein JXA52_05705 [Planctomycetes bacterium]|nr:hypothetical protein [Planctomycetota bacterium]